MDNLNGQMTSQRRLIAMVEALVAAGINGATSAQLIKTLSFSAPTVSRDLAVLVLEGWAEKTDSSWRISPFFGQLSASILASFEVAQRELEIVAQRYGGSSAMRDASLQCVSSQAAVSNAAKEVRL